MRRIATSNVATNLFGAGKNGFSASNPGGGILATKLSAAFFNDAQEELIAPIELAGMALDPDGTHEHQLLAAIIQMTGAGQVITKTHADSGHQLTEDEAGLIMIDASGGVVNLTLPSATRPQVFRFCRIDSTPANSSTITAHGTDPYNGVGAPGSFTMKPLERREMMSTTGGWREFGHFGADGSLANVWYASTQAVVTTSSNSWTTLINSIAVTKKRATNLIYWDGFVAFQNDSSSSGAGTTGSFRLTYNTGGADNQMDAQILAGMSTSLSGATNDDVASMITIDNGTLPQSYTLKPQISAANSTVTKMNATAVRGIEIWA